MKDTQIKLVTVVRADLVPGAQIAQTGHSIAEFAHKFPSNFNDWVETSNYLISLSIQNETRLKYLFERLKNNGVNVVAFHEPDINDQMTSLCFYGTPELRKITNKLNLALKN